MKMWSAARGERNGLCASCLKYSLEGITGFSVAPLSVAAVLGVVFCGVSFLMILFLVIRTLIWGDPVAGWPSMVCVILFMGGIQLLCMGIMGEYLSKTYLESKHRPIYIIRSSSYEKSNAKEKICGLASYAVLAVLTVAACWFFAGRYGVFGANMDWISQHSVFPEYFRQQFLSDGTVFSRNTRRTSAAGRIFTIFPIMGCIIRSC